MRERTVPNHHVSNRQAAQVAETAEKPRRSKRAPWTKKEEKIIQKYFAERGAQEVAAMLGRKVGAVQQRAAKLGIRSTRSRAWTEMERRYLEKKYPQLTAQQIARTLKRSLQSVRAQIHVMKLGGTPHGSWTEEEVRFIRDNYKKMHWAAIATKLGRTVYAVQLKASRLGISDRANKVTPDQVAFIAENVGKIAFTEMSRRTGLSVSTVRSVAVAHGYRDRPTSRPWTAEEDEKLRTIYHTMSRAEVARELDRTVVAVAFRATELGITRKYRPRGDIRRWTEEEDALIRQLYGTMPAAEIATHLNRTVPAVVQRIGTLGIRKRRYRTKKSREQAGQQSAGDE
jgi:hypothetical protein